MLFNVLCQLDSAMAPRGKRSRKVSRSIPPVPSAWIASSSKSKSKKKKSAASFPDRPDVGDFVEEQGYVVDISDYLNRHKKEAEDVHPSQDDIDKALYDDIMSMIDKEKAESKAPVSKHEPLLKFSPYVVAGKAKASRRWNM